MEKYTEFFIDSVNGNINIIESINNNNSKDILLFLHGFGGHFQPIDDSLDNINNRIEFFKDFQIFAVEFYGHGKSDGDKFYITSIDDYIQDIINTINYIENYIIINKLKSKIYIYANSFSCAIVLKYLIEYKVSDYIKGIIFTAPMFKLQKFINKTTEIIFMSYLLCIISTCFSKYQMNINNSNNYIDKCKYTNNLIYCYDYKKMYINTIYELLNIQLWISNNMKLFKNIKLPILVFQGLDDNIVDINTTILVCNQFKNKDVISFEQGTHTLLLPNTSDDNISKILFNKVNSWINNI
jgi:alpha-beta hydrolase superfamily lysophospholipase